MNTEPTPILIDALISMLRPSYAKQGKTAIYQDIANRLSCVALKSPPWTWRYVQGIHAGTIVPGIQVDLAAVVLLAQLEDSPSAPIYSPSETVQVHALTGTITPGAWILDPSRPCADPSCTNHFVPRVAWQLYCPLHSHH